MKKYFNTLALLSVLSLQAEDILQIEQTKNNGLLGQSYINASLGSVYPADKEFRDVLDSILLAELQGSYKLTDNIALGLSILSTQLKISDTNSYGSYSGESDSLRISASALYHFLPKERIDPFISIEAGTLSWNSKSQYSGSGYSDNSSDSDSYNIYSLEAGAEFDVSESIFLTPSIVYSDGDADYMDPWTIVYLTMDVKITDMIYAGGKIGVNTDDGNDILYSLGITAKF